MEEFTGLAMYFIIFVVASFAIMYAVFEVAYLAQESAIKAYSNWKRNRVYDTYGE